MVDKVEALDSEHCLEGGGIFCFPHLSSETGGAALQQIMSLDMFSG